MRLAGASLAIGENTDVVAVKSALDHTLDGSEDFLLIVIVCEHFVKLELVR